MSEQRDKFNHERRLRAVSAGMKVKAAGAVEAHEASDEEYILHLEQENAQLRQICENQAHMLYLDPTKLDQLKPPQGG